ncbi:hypothetical protein AB0K60_07670 [Thermopolyspora sp. NPDC052614]|uniref:hypothetical protein n=1 Tax=Thermopolyspora sp. NPDC052614 TaxID=3155682 RepID=UPI0034363F9A
MPETETGEATEAAAETSRSAPRDTDEDAEKTVTVDPSSSAGARASSGRKDAPAAEDASDGQDTQDVEAVWNARGEDGDDREAEPDEDALEETTLIQGFAPIRIDDESGVANGAKATPGSAAADEDAGSGEDADVDPDSTMTFPKIDISAIKDAGGAGSAKSDTTKPGTAKPGATKTGATKTGTAKERPAKSGSGQTDAASAGTDADLDPDSTAAISKADIQAAIAAAERADKADKADKKAGKQPVGPTSAAWAGERTGDRPKGTAEGGGRGGADASADEAAEFDPDSTAAIPKIVLPKDGKEKGRGKSSGSASSRVESFPVQKSPSAPSRDDSEELDDEELNRTPARPRPIPRQFRKDSAAATPPAADPSAKPAPAERPEVSRSGTPAPVEEPRSGAEAKPAIESATPEAAPEAVAPSPEAPAPAAPGPSKTSWWRRQRTPETEPESRPESRPDSRPESKPESRPEPETLPDPNTTAVVSVEAPAKAAPAAHPKPEAKPAQAPRLGRVATWLPPLLTLEGLIMYVLSLKVPPGFLRGVDLNQINGLGLISVLPGAALASIVLLIVAFFITLVQNLDRKGVLLFQLAAITFALHGAAALVEDEPRFHTAWVHAGFAEYIGRVGEAIPGLDARFSWPGFFSVFGFLTRSADIADYALILKWWPLLMNLLYLVPFVLILRQIVATTRARWFAALLFVVVQWIGQDYFSPQGFTYLWYLMFVAIVLRWFGKVEHRTGPLPPKGFIRRTLARLDRLTPGELPPQGADGRDRLITLLLLIGLFTATAATHQVTPFMMLGALTGFILLRRTTFTLALPVFLGLIVVAWLSYQATPYWSGHFDQLFGGIGRIFDNLQENTGDRLVGTDPQHAIVLQVRLGILAVVLLLAAIGLLRRLHRGVVDRVAVVLLCIPVLALGLQSYGGEIGLRVYLFAIPGTCILAAYAFFPNPQLSVDAPEIRPQRVPRLDFLPKLNPTFARNASITLAAVTAVALAGAFLIARYGNEKFERITTDEAAAMRYIYDHDKPSARALYLVPELNQEITPTIPWRERDIDVVEYREALAPQDPTQISHLITQLRTLGPQTYLLATRGQDAYLELNHGYPADWGTRFRETLDKSKQLKAVFKRPDAAVYVLKSYPKGTEVPAPASFQLVGDRSTPWTPYGLAGLGITWITLFGYEALRLNGVDDRWRKARRSFLAIAIPAAFVAIAVVVERFVELGFDPLQQ